MSRVRETSLIAGPTMSEEGTIAESRGGTHPTMTSASTDGGEAPNNAAITVEGWVVRTSRTSGLRRVNDSATAKTMSVSTLWVKPTWRVFLADEYAARWALRM